MGVRRKAGGCDSFVPPIEPLRIKDYDPLQTLRDRLAALERRVLDGEQRLADTDRRIGTLAHWREKRQRYSELRFVRTRAIRALVALGKLTFEEIGQAFGITKHRAEQIAKRALKAGRPRKDREFKKGTEE